MKSKFHFCIILLCLLSACMPVARQLAVSPSSAPVTVGECFITPHNFYSQANSIPMAVAVNVPGKEGISLIWQDGSSLGTWQTGLRVARVNVHLAGQVSGVFDEIPLVFMGSGDNGQSHMNVILGGQENTLKEFPRNATVTSLIGVPGKPLLAYSTVETLGNGSLLRSQVFLGDYQTIASTSPVLTVEDGGSSIILLVAIHRDLNDTPDGLWYTSSPWGIGGDSWVDPRQGLYYLDLGTGERLEFLSSGCNFSNLSIGQNWAAWELAGVLYAADLHTGKTVSFPLLPGNDHGPIHAFIGPGDGYIAWLEGKGSDWDGTLETTLRIGTLEGYLVGEYPPSTFVATSGLGEGIAVVPLGWISSENYSVLIMVYNALEDKGVLLGLDANTGQVSILSKVSEDGFAGFGYP